MRIISKSFEVSARKVTQSEFITWQYGYFMKSLLIGYKSKWTLALFILLIFIELVSVLKSAKKEKKEKELGQHPPLGQWMRIECGLCIGVFECKKI